MSPAAFKSHKRETVQGFGERRGAHQRGWWSSLVLRRPMAWTTCGAQVFLLDGGERLGRRVHAVPGAVFRPRRYVAQNGMVYDYKAKPGSEDSILEQISDICISMKAEDYLQLPDVTFTTRYPVVLDAKALEGLYHDLETGDGAGTPGRTRRISVRPVRRP